MATVEPFHLASVEDLLTGDCTPYPNADLYRDLKMQTSVPIHTGEQIDNRANCKDLIEKQAVDVLGPDPEDVGGIAARVHMAAAPRPFAQPQIPCPPRAADLVKGALLHHPDEKSAEPKAKDPLARKASTAVP